MPLEVGEEVVIIGPDNVQLLNAVLTKRTSDPGGRERLMFDRPADGDVALGSRVQLRVGTHLRGEGTLAILAGETLVVDHYTDVPLD